jgi:hypothetical protein
MTISRYATVVLTLLGVLLLVTTASPSVQTGCTVRWDVGCSGYGAGWDQDYDHLCDEGSGAECQWYNNPLCNPSEYQICYGSNPEYPGMQKYPVPAPCYTPNPPIACGGSLLCEILATGGAGARAKRCTPMAMCIGSQGSQERIAAWENGSQYIVIGHHMVPCICP